MLTKQRKQRILGMLKRDGQVVAKELSREWNISEDTVRRDLRELAAEGLLQRVHGGALPVSAALQSFAAREHVATGAKARLGRAGAGMVRPGQIVMIDGGTTNAHLVRHLPADLRATIITHSPSIAVELVDHEGIEVILIGGKLFKHSLVSVGTMTIEAVARLRADLFFMGATGLHPELGVTTGDLEEAYVKRAFSERSAETVVLASRDKLNAASPYLVVPIEGLDGVVVEADVEDSVLEGFLRKGVSITRAG